MGPFPHDAPAATLSAANPMGTDGFEFVEYAHPEPAQLHALFRLMGYVPVARHRGKPRNRMLLNEIVNLAALQIGKADAIA